MIAEAVSILLAKTRLTWVFGLLKHIVDPSPDNWIPPRRLTGDLLLLGPLDGQLEVF